MKEFNKTVLSFHAHPDDAEAWNAGTLKLLKDKGYRIVIATMTGGDLGGCNMTMEETARVRYEEARKAAEVLDAEYYTMGGTDGFLFDSMEMRLKVISLIRKVKAGIIFTHLPVDYHSDHRTTANIVETAAMVSSLDTVPVKEKPVEITPLLYHSSPLTLSDPLGSEIIPPHFFVNVSSVIETEKEMLGHHISQIELMRHMHKMDDFFGFVLEGNRNYGKLAGVEYAEVYWQHLGGGFQKEPQVSKRSGRVHYKEKIEYMNLNDEKYNRYALVREMMETPEIFRNFKPSVAQRFLKKIKSKKGLLLTGEGSSRIFPAKRAIYALRRAGSFFNVITEGSAQAAEYPLNDYAIFAASNSGQTKEVVRLIYTLEKRNHDSLFGLTANKNTKLEELATDTHVLSCGKEQAVAATKSVMEQGLFYDAIVRGIAGYEMNGLSDVAEKIEEALTAEIDPQIIERILKAEVIYFAGRNNGVAEELALKTNEITRKKSAFLEGTFAVHGIEEVMDKDDVLIWIEPFQEEETKFIECLEKGVGMSVFAISCEHTPFHGMRIPFGGQYAEYIKLAAGWNLLVEVGIALGIDLDKPVRARKVGNEYTPGT